MADDENKPTMEMPWWRRVRLDREWLVVAIIVVYLLITQPTTPGTAYVVALMGLGVALGRMIRTKNRNAAR